MRIALIGVDGSKVDVSEAVAEFVSQNYADVELLRSTAPDILKIPAAAKRALGEADAAIVFATATAPEQNKTLTFGIAGPASAVLTDADRNAYAVSRK